MRLSVACITLLFIYTVTTCANTFDIKSSVSRSKLYENETTVLTLTVNGAEKDIYNDIVLPDVSTAFHIVSSSQSSSFSYVNGTVKRS